jgi:hypothetical protein
MRPEATSVWGLKLVGTHQVPAAASATRAPLPPRLHQQQRPFARRVNTSRRIRLAGVFCFCVSLSLSRCRAHFFCVGESLGRCRAPCCFISYARCRAPNFISYAPPCYFISYRIMHIACYVSYVYYRWFQPEPKSMLRTNALLRNATTWLAHGFVFHQDAAR